MNQILAMRALVRVIEAASFSRASEQLAIPRSTVSKLIVDLENYLDVKLIQRTTRAFTVTSEGHAYYLHAARLLAELDEVDYLIKGRNLNLYGNLRVDAPASFANFLLIPALPEFYEEHPEITIALGISDRSTNMVEEGIDCVIRAGRSAELSMISRRLTELEYVTCAAPKYLELMGIPTSPEDLEKNHKKIGYFSSSNHTEPLIFERAPLVHQVNGFSFSTNEGNGLKEMLLAGLGVGQHFKSIMHNYVESGELVPVLQEWTRPALPLHIMYPANQHQPARLKVFIQWIIKKFGVSG